MTAADPVDISYDDIPYPDLCYRATHPGRLAAVAGLLDVQTVPVQECRVLEIGCAGGANIIPMAFGLPGSEFVGIDLSGRQIESAQHFAAELGLRNLHLQAMDVMDVTPEFGTFDYIIAHGVYSWVPPEVRDKTLSVCRANLSPTGVAYVSYNTFPGWHLMLMVREMMLYGTRHVTDPTERANAARALTVDVRSMIPDAGVSTFADFLDSYVDTRLGNFAGDTAWEDSAMLHDELGAVNDPVYFHEFVDHAGRHHLQYLGDATYPQSDTRDLAAEAIARLHEMSRDHLEFEQYLDYVVQRTFRRSLLCHEGVDIRRTPTGRDLGDLYVSSRAQLIDDEDGDYFGTSDGSMYSSDDPVTMAAMRHLSEVAPRAVHFPALLTEACRRAGITGPDAVTSERLSTDLLDASTDSGQLVELLAHDLALTPLPSERPLASPIVRLQMQRSSVVSNLCHEPIGLNGLNRAVVALLDGRHTRGDLLGELLDMLDDGRMSSAQDDSWSRAQLEQQLADDIDRALRWLGRSGVLLS